MTAPNDGTQICPSDASVPPKFFVGLWDDVTTVFWALRADNSSAKNLRVALHDGTGTPLGTAGNPLRVEPAGSSSQTVVGRGTPGAPLGGVLSVQGVVGGVPFPVTGTFADPSVGPTGFPVPASAAQIGGSDGTNLQSARVFDLDPGGGFEYNLGVSLRLPFAGGSVAGGTSTNPLRTDPTGTTIQPVSGTVSADQGTAAPAVAPWSVRLSDGAAFYIGAQQGQLPAALVGGRLDVNVGASVLPTGAATQATLATLLLDGTFTSRINTLGQKTMAASTPIVIASDQSAIPVTGTVTATNPSVGTNAVVAPTSSTQIGGSDGLDLQAARVFDLDTGVGTEFGLGVSLRLPGAGGSVAGGTATDPLRTDPTGTTTQPVSGTVTANQGTSAGAAAPWSSRLSDGAAFYDATKTGQLPAALVGGRLDVNVGASALPTGAATQATLATLLLDATFTSRINTLGQKTMAASTPVVIASDQSAITVTGTVTATNASVGVNAAAAPTSSTQIGASDGTNLQSARAFDLDTGAGTEFDLGVSLRLPGAGGSVAGGTATDPLRVDPTGTTTQPVSGTVTANQGTSAGAAAPWSTRLSDGAAFYDATKTGQLPAALVAGRLDVNAGAWLGSTAPTVGQKTAANSLPVVLASDQPAPADGTASGTLNAANAAVTLTLAGHASAALDLAAGTLIGTIVPELSFDGGTTWVATQFWDPAAQTLFPSVVFAANNTSTQLTIVLAGGAGSARVRVSAFTSGTAAATARATSTEPAIVATTRLDGTKRTYSAGILDLSIANSATDFFTLTGAAGKVVRVTRIEAMTTATSTVVAALQLVKRSTADTAGTSTTLTNVPHDSADAAASATVKAYTANPTLGTLVGVVRAGRTGAPSATASTDPGRIVWDFGERAGARAIVLRSASEALALNLNGVTETGNLWAISVEWTEEG